MSGLSAFNIYGRTKQASLQGVPLEVLIRILENLEARQLARCTAVCVGLKRVIDSSLKLQYIIKLGLYGYQNGAHANEDGTLLPISSTASRLERLERHVKRWDTLDWNENRIRVPRRNETDVFELSGGVFAIVQGKQLSCVQLPSRIRSISSPNRPPAPSAWNSWGLELDVEPKDIAFDPEQDLLILVQLFEREMSEDDRDGMCHAAFLHVLSLESNGQHPRASQPVLYGIENYSADVKVHSIQIMGDLLGMVFYDPVYSYSQLEVWNWVDGRLISELRHTPHHPRDSLTAFASFTFVGPSNYLVPRDGGIIDVYEFSQEEDLETLIPTLVTSFLMPALAPHAFGALTVISEPLPYTPRSHHLLPNTESDSTSSLSTPKLFYPSEEERIIKFKWQLVNDAGMELQSMLSSEHGFNIPFPLAAPPVRTFDFYVPSRVFRHCGRSFSHIAPNGSDPDAPIRVPWELWGPQNARFNDSPSSSQHAFPRHVFGSRVVQVDHGSNALSVIDFARDRNRKRRGGRRVDASPNSVTRHIKTTKSHVEGDGYLIQDVTSSLPYEIRKRQLDFEHDPSLVMADDERIICMKEIVGSEETELIILSM